MTTHRTVLLLIATMAMMGALVERAGRPYEALPSRVQRFLQPVSDDALAQLAQRERVRALLSARARRILEQPDAVTLYSIDPDVYREYGYTFRAAPSPQAHALNALASGDGVLGSLDVRDWSLRRNIVAGLYEGLADPNGHMMCYDPRHALVYRAGREYVVVHICFSCFYAVVLEPDTEEGRYREFGNMVATFWNHAPWPLWDILAALLESANIPTAK